VTSIALSVDLARCNALVTDATVVSRRCATSSAFQHNTSRRISTALCRGGRCCSAATNARRIISRCTANSSGLLFISATLSGIGWIQICSDIGSSMAGPAFAGRLRSMARARRCALRSTSRQTFVAVL
jgi:hypothetical protein